MFTDTQYHDVKLNNIYIPIQVKSAFNLYALKNKIQGASHQKFNLASIQTSKDMYCHIKNKIIHTSHLHTKCDEKNKI